jgi:hypothetical protein
MVCTGESYYRERVSTVDLLVLTCSDQLLLILKVYIYFFYQTSYINEEGDCTEPSPTVRITWHHILPPSLMVCTGESYYRGRISTVDLLVLTYLDQLLLILKVYIYFFYKTSNINEEVDCTEPSLTVRISWQYILPPLLVVCIGESLLKRKGSVQLTSLY